MVKRKRRSHRCSLWRRARGAIVWILTAGAVMVFAYRTRDGATGSRTIYWWLPVIVSFSLVLVRSCVRLVAHRGSPSLRGQVSRLVWGAVLATTAVGTAAAFLFAAPPLPDLERFATGIGGTAVLATAGAWLITSPVWARVRRTRRHGGPPGPETMSEGRRVEPGVSTQFGLRAGSG